MGGTATPGLPPRPEEFLPPSERDFNRRVLIPAPEVLPHPSARDFYDFGTQAAQTLAMGVLILAQFPVPAQRVAVVRDIVLNVNNMLATTNIIWRLRQNGSLLPGYGAMTLAGRAAASVASSTSPDSTLIRISEGAIITLESEVFDAGAYDVSCSFHGWHYASALDAKYRSAWE